MATDVLTPILRALAKVGATLLPEKKEQLENMILPLADSDANAVVSAIASHIEMHGMAGLMNDSLRNALTASEPDFDQIINSNIVGGIDALTKLLSEIAAGSG